MSLLDWLFPPEEELVTYTATYDGGDEETEVTATVGGHDPDSQRSVVQAIKKYETAETGREPDKITIHSRTRL